MELSDNRSDDGSNGRATTHAPGAGEADRVTKLLFALPPHAAHPDAALKSARALAATMRAELHVVSLLPPMSRPAVHGDELPDLSEAQRHVAVCVAACRETRAWCEETLGEPLALDRLRIRIGKAAEAIARRATELDAHLVVLSPSAQPLGRTALDVARARGRPVLVARGASAPGVIIAATDLRDDEYRVVRRASALGAALGSRVVAVHNVSCLSTPLGACLDAGANPVPELPRRMLSELPAPLDWVVTTELDPVSAILQQAQQHRSDMIVVGARPRADRRGQASVPSEVIDRSRCSVLVTSL